MKFAFLIPFGLLLSATAFAGDKIGNGGALWACENSQQQIQSAMLVDLFEAKTEFGWDLTAMPGLNAQQIASQTSQVLKDVNSVYTDKLTNYLSEVLSDIQYVDAALVTIDDALPKIQPLPSTCTAGAWQYVQFANFTDQNQVLIRSDIWKSNLVTEMDKGALLIHEAVYRWMRVEYSDTTSVRSREIVGLLFSKLSADVINSKIQDLLSPSSTPIASDSWACMIKNTNANKYFLGFGQTQQESSFNASQICTQNTSAFFCAQTSAECEQAQSDAVTWTCFVNNQNNFTNFDGKGRTKIEASYNALKSCEDASDGGFFCNNPTCNQVSSPEAQ